MAKAGSCGNFDTLPEVGHRRMDDYYVAVDELTVVASEAEAANLGEPKLALNWNSRMVVLVVVEGTMLQLQQRSRVM